MKKPVLILLAMVAVTVGVYYTCFHMATRDTRRMLATEDSIAWLRAEFAINDEQARAITALEADFELRCAKMCARISQSGERLEKLLRESTAMTPELEAAMRDASQTQADCRASTLAQAFAISAHMAPAQGARYREMIARRILPTVLREHAIAHH